MRFTSHKKIKDLIELPSMNLKKKGVSVSFMAWDGDCELYDELHEVWVTRFCTKRITWRAMSSIAAAFGILVNEDWHGIFHSFCEKLRLQIAVRDPSKTPVDKLMEIDKYLYLLSFSVDNKPDEDATGPKESDISNEPKNDLLVEELDDDQNAEGGGGAMDTGGASNGKTPAPSSPSHRSNRHVSHAHTRVNVQTHVLESKIQSAIQDAPMISSRSLSDVVFKKPEDNICTRLLPHFDEES